MTCRHAPGDTNCSSHPFNVQQRESERENERRLEREKQTRALELPATPDSENYEITEFHRVGAHLVMKVRYPNCNNCAYEGNKVMVYLNVTEAQVIKWRRIDPHFKDPKKALTAKEAPPPAARFPGSPGGWQDAIDYANSKSPYGTKDKK